MALNIKGGDCDDAVRPTECNVPLGTPFTLSVDALGAPSAGYIFASTFIHFGAQLSYAPSSQAADEIVWPECSSNTAVRKQVDFNLPPFPAPVDYVVLLSCFTSGLIPPPLSFFTGNLVEINLTCSIGDTTSIIQLLPRLHPVASTSGSVFVGGDGLVTEPKSGDLLLNCGSGGTLPTPTFTPTFTPTSPPMDTPEPPTSTPTGGTETPTATPTATETPLPSTKGNHNFADAIAISGPLPFGNVQVIDNDVFEPGEPSPCADIVQTVWFSYTPPVNVVLTADTLGSNGDPALAVYTGSSLTTLTNLACDDNGGPGDHAEVVVNAAAGTTYYFQVGEHFGGEITSAFNLHGPPAKGNDNFSGAFVISTSLPYSNKEDAGGATLEPGEPRPCAQIDNTVWYSYTPVANGVVAADTSGSDFDTALAVYTGSSLGSLVNVACDNDAGFGNESRIAFVVQAGVTYYIQAGWTAEGRGNSVLNLSAETAPTKGNDDFANAAVVGQPLPFSNKLDTAGATLEPGEPQACGATAGTVWYKLTPVTDVIVRGNTAGSDAEDPRLAAYTGDALSNLTLIDCGTRFFVASAGQTYYFQLGGCALADCTESYGSLQINLPDFPCSPLGCPELAFNIPGADCDDLVRPQACNVPLGTKFTLSLDILAAPVEGYPLLQSFIRYGDDLLYDLGSSTLSQEMTWPDCVIGVRFQIDGTLADPNETTSHVSHGCFTSLLPPAPASHYVGQFIQLSMTCSSTPSSSDVTLLLDGHPSTITSGTAFVLAPQSPEQVLLPKVSALSVNCVDAAPAAVGGVALSGELRGIAAQNGKIPWLWAALGFAGIVAFSALAIARRRNAVSG